MRPPTPGALPGLLTIDVAAERRKLALGALEGTWQLPAELVRRALGAGARRVEVALARGSVRVHDDGAPLPLALLEPLRRLFEPDGSAQHQALVALEAQGALALAALAALPGLRVRIDSAGREGGWRFAAGAGAAARLEPLGASPGGTTLALDGLAYDAERAREWLHAVGRFRADRVRLDGRPLYGGFGPVVAETSLRPPLMGRLGLPLAEDVARVWLLVDGIVSAHLTLPDAPPFAAAVELTVAQAGPASAAALRESLAPQLGELVDQGVRLALSASRAVRGLAPEARRQLRAILLEAARRRWRTGEVLCAAAWQAFDGPERGEAWLSLLDLGRLGGHGRRPILAVARPEEAERVAGPGPVLVLEPEERARLTERLGLAFCTPQPLRHRPPLLWRLHEGAARALRSARDRWLAARRGATPLPDSALSASERALLAALADAVPRPFVLGLEPGRGRARRAGDRILLGRDAPLLHEAARVLAADPAAAYPALLALLGSLALPQPEARERWRRAFAPAEV